MCISHGRSEVLGSTVQYKYKYFITSCDEEGVKVVKEVGWSQSLLLVVHHD